MAFRMRGSRNGLRGGRGSKRRPTTHEANPWPAAMGRDHPVFPELSVGGISSGGIVERQHKRMRKTISLAGCLSTANTYQFQRNNRTQLEVTYEEA